MSGPNAAVRTHRWREKVIVYYLDGGSNDILRGAAIGGIAVWNPIPDVPDFVRTLDKSKAMMTVGFRTRAELTVKQRSQLGGRAGFSDWQEDADGYVIPGTTFMWIVSNRESPTFQRNVAEHEAGHILFAGDPVSAGTNGKRDHSADPGDVMYKDVSGKAFWTLSQKDVNSAFRAYNP